MTPRFRTAFSVPSGFSAATPATTAAPTKSGAKGANVESSGRRIGKSARKDKSPSLRGSEAA